MSLPKTYQPNDYEPSIYAMWETSGAFNPTGKGEPYSIVMPPPNANGNLHVGHPLFVATQDILIRYHRMKGRDTIYIPGLDHAGFETWVVYERELEKQGKSRFDFTREQLYGQVWNFVEEKRGDIELQLRALGASASWGNLVFTLDEKVIKTVYKTFKRLWDEGHIYRGERIVNCCTFHKTSFADIEVEHETKKAKLWDIAYPTLDSIGEIVVSTTRPETMLGDTAIAVHPDDERYKHLVGTKALLPLCDREIPIIADSYVDMNFGTGAVKITPAHDPNDFEIAKRHNLEMRNIIDMDGKMENVPRQYVGLDTETARKHVLRDLEAGEYRRGEKDIEHAVGKCYKCGTVIQPMLSDQWFLNTKPLAERAKEVIASGEITFTPAGRGQSLSQYLDGLHDWNLSRQIPWGIPIPAFQNENDPNDWIFDDRVDQEKIVVNDTTYIRDDDTFDTWFSSGQWPFITTDALDGGDLSRFYPNSVMETGYDLLDRWVARMIMLGLYMTDQVPFRHVYLHGMVNDEKNQKMSKSKGNVINPIEILSEYGSDALRLGIIASRSAAQSQAFSISKVVTGRNFCNKLWNIARYIEGSIGDTMPRDTPAPQTLADHWVVGRLLAARDTLDRQLADYRFAEAAETVYHTIWDDVADWYIEASKSEQNRDMMAWVLDTSLRLAHPFAPFVTETIWQALPWHDDLLIAAAWPTDVEYSEIAAAEFEQLASLITEIRFVSAELPGTQKYRLLYSNDSLIADNIELIKRLARLESIELTDQARGLRLANYGREAWIDIDADTLYQHQTNLENRLASVRDDIQKLESRLANENYVKNAPEKLVEETKQQLADKQSLEQRLERELETINQ